MKQLHFKGLIGGLLFMTLISGCGGESAAPTAEELKSKLVGSYCSGYYKLVLSDNNTYLNQRIQKSIYNGAPILEKCEGTFRLEASEDESSWFLIYERSTENSNKIVVCEGKVEIWQKEKGFMPGDSLPVLQELFDGTDVTMNNCN